MMPQRAETRNLVDGSVSLRFTNYTEAPQNAQPVYNDRDEERMSSDEENIIEHTVAVFQFEEEEEQDPPQPVHRGTDEGDGYATSEGEKVVWDTLGLPSGKFDYLVKYTPPPATTSIEKIIPTGWGDDDEQTTTHPEWKNSDAGVVGVPAILHPKYKDSDEGSIDGQEEYIAIGGSSSDELEWWMNIATEEGEVDYPKRKEEVFVNPFGQTPEASDNEENHVVAAGEINETKYPVLKSLLKETVAASEQSAISNYRPPHDISMTPVGYPPVPGNVAGPSNAPQPPAFKGYDKRKNPRFKRDNYNEWWNLPSAQASTGAIFVIPRQLGLFHDVFSRWESITKNYVAMQGFTDAADKIEFIENMLGEVEKITWIHWRMLYPAEFEQLKSTADGREGTHNILSQIRRVFSLEDPATRTTHIQEDAYKNLEKLTCDNVKNIIQYLNDYLKFAAKSGRMYVREELSEKLWSKMPGELGMRMKATFSESNPGNTIGVLPRILFAYKYLENECKEAAFKRSLKNLSFCREIPLPRYYGGEKSEKRYGLRKSTTYKGKPHASHARVEKRKYLVKNKNCKCYLCGEEGHFARECPSEKRNVNRVAVFENLEILEDYDIVSVSDGEEQSDAIYSISEGEDGEPIDPLAAGAIKEYCFYFREEDMTYWMGKNGGYLPMVRDTEKQHECQHDWQFNQVILESNAQRCKFCSKETSQRARMHCQKCLLTSCEMCSLHYYDIKITRQPAAPIQYNEKPLLQQQQEYTTYMEAENRRLKDEVFDWRTKAENYKEELLAKAAEKVINLEKDEEIHQLKAKIAMLEAENEARRVRHIERRLLRKQLEDEERKNKMKGIMTEALTEAKSVGDSSSSSEDEISPEEKQEMAENLEGRVLFWEEEMATAQ